jgi:hypothetical protein
MRNQSDQCQKADHDGPWPKPDGYILLAWQKSLFWGGVIVYAAMCMFGGGLPVEALFIGPAMMLAGVIMMSKTRQL